MTEKSEQLEVVNPATGEALDLKTASSGQLLEIVRLLRADELRFANWRRSAEDEVIARMDATGKRIVVVPTTAGEVEIQIKSNRESVWDADELDSVLADIVGRGLLAPKAAAGVVNRDVKVDRTKAQKLLDRFAPDTPEWRAINGCRTWRAKGRRSLLMTDVPNLEDVAHGAR